MQIAIRIVATIALFASTIAETGLGTPFRLESLTREVIRAAYGTSCFSSLAIQGAPAKSLFSAPMPTGYHAIRHGGLDSLQYPPFTLVAANSRDCFVGVATGWTVESAEAGYEVPPRWLVTVEDIVQPMLGPAYTTYPLHNGVVYTERGRPTVELVLLQGLIPSETMSWSYNLYVLVFQKGATVLALDEPCAWWALPGTTRWTPRTYKGVCDRRWVRWTPAFKGG
jgi:hypothetical protein